MKRLKFIDLSYSEDFTETPDFSGVPCLEHLCLHCCKSLVKVHSSLGELKELVEVYLSGCKNLEILPKKLETNSLMKLDLRWCKKVAVLPEFGKGMKKLSYLDASYTSIARLPESLGSLTGLRDLNLSGCKILNLDKLWKTHMTRQISVLNVTTLTELYLRECGLNDGSILDGFGNLSSLIVLDLSGNGFVNPPAGCFSSLSRLVFLSLDSCKRLKSLPRLPPRLIQLCASSCDSMEPVSESQLWNLVASLDHQYRQGTKYVISYEEYDYIPLEFKLAEAECLPLKDFCAIIPGSEIPSWFPNKEYYALDENGRECVVKVKIPPYLRYSEWSAIVVCFHILSGSDNALIPWSRKAAKYTIQIRQLCIMVLELNEITCWQHLRGPRDYYRFCNPSSDKILGCGWRLICKEEIEWCKLNYFNQLTRPQLAPPHEIKLPKRVLDSFIGKVFGELLIQDPYKNGQE